MLKIRLRLPNLQFLAGKPISKTPLNSGFFENFGLFLVSRETARRFRLFHVKLIIFR